MVADDRFAFLTADTANIQPDRRIELERLPPVVVSGLPNITPIFSRSWLMKTTAQFDR
jgi:hypothetical protein